MTESISIYEKYNIDLNRLSRDYLKFPLRKGTGCFDKPEYPTKEDIEYLYLELNLTLYMLEEFFGFGEYKILDFLRKYNIRKPPKLKVERTKNTNIQKYGAEHPMQVKELKQNAINTYKLKTGYENPSQNPEVKKKKIETCLKHFGTEHPSQNKEIFERQCQNYFEKTGYYTPFENPEIIEKIKQSNIKNHNGVHSNNCEEVKKKKEETCKNHFGETSHMKNKEFMQKYLDRQIKTKGYKCTFQDPKTKEKIKNFYKTNYGCDTNAQIHVMHFENLNEEYFRLNFIKNGKFLINECCEYFNIVNNTACSYKEKFNITEPNQSRKCLQERLWLDLLNIKNRKLRIKHNNNKKYYPDGYVIETNTIYEYLGDFYHGNPKIYKHDNINVRNGKTFGDLYRETFERFDIIKSLGYNIIYIWESDFIINGKIQENWKEKMKEY